MGWPQAPQHFPKRRALAVKMQEALESVGMADMPMDTKVRRVAGSADRAAREHR